jgi:hypothetical protein
MTDAEGEIVPMTYTEQRLAGLEAHIVRLEEKVSEMIENRLSVADRFTAICRDATMAHRTE